MHVTAYIVKVILCRKYSNFISNLHKIIYFYRQLYPYIQHQQAVSVTSSSRLNKITVPTACRKQKHFCGGKWVRVSLYCMYGRPKQEGMGKGQQPPVFWTKKASRKIFFSQSDKYCHTLKLHIIKKAGEIPHAYVFISSLAYMSVCCKIKVGNFRESRANH